MKKIKIFLASSNELIDEREKFEREIYRKNKLWIDCGVSLHLDIWEDFSTRMSTTRSQDEYNNKVKQSDLFVLLAYSKVGMYTAEEFETAFGAFQSTQKPFVFTYFKNINSGVEASLQDFKNKLENLWHFYSHYNDFNDLWIQFNKELDRLLIADFNENEQVWKNKDGTFVDNRGVSIKNQFNNGTFNDPVFN